LPPNKSPKSRFGSLLRRYRREHKCYTQTDLHNLLKGKGCDYSLSSINKYETGERTPKPEFIADIAVYLELVDDEVSLLIDVAMVEFWIKFRKEFNEAMAQRKKFR
jgi:transcriptional regulator with XRE-family HTH domain